MARRKGSFMVAAILLGIAVLMSLTCGAQGAASSAKKILIGSSSPGGTYYGWSTGVLVVMKEKLGMEADITITGGGVNNCTAINIRKVDIGMIACPVAFEAYNSKRDFQGNPHTNLRTIFLGYVAVWQPYVWSDSSIASLQDLTGSKIAIGEPGSNHNMRARIVFETLNINPRVIHEIPWADAKNLFADGSINAMFTTSACPDPSITELEATKPIRIIPIPEVDAQKIIERHPDYEPAFIPKGTYKCATEPIPTIGSYGGWFAHKDVSEEFVYELTKAVFESIDILTAAHGSARNLNLEMQTNASVPFHVGAYKYFREMNVEIPERLVPPELQNTQPRS